MRDNIYIDVEDDINIFNVSHKNFNKIKKLYPKHYTKVGDTEWVEIDKITFFKD